MKKKQEQTFETLLPSFDEHLKSAIAEMVKHQVEMALKNSTTLTKEFYNLKEVEHITGITICGLKNRRKRCTLRMVNEGNVVLMSKTELERLLATLKRAS